MPVDGSAGAALSILRYTVPNAVTSLSLLLGIASIMTSQLGDLELAAWLIVWCGLLDTVDGVVARALKATSSFGAEFDSMADLVSFGVAPSVLMLNAGMQLGGVDVGSNAFRVLAVACGVFALAGAMRLARFNLPTENPPPRGWFIGVPTTACGGGLLTSMVLVLIYYPEIAASLPLALYFPVLLFVLAIFMVSRIYFPKATLRESRLINAFQIANLLLIFYCGITRSFPEYLFSIGVFLLVSGIIAGRIMKSKLDAQPA